MAVRRLRSGVGNKMTDLYCKGINQGLEFAFFVSRTGGYNFGSSGNFFTRRDVGRQSNKNQCLPPHPNSNGCAACFFSTLSCSHNSKGFLFQTQFLRFEIATFQDLDCTVLLMTQRMWMNEAFPRITWYSVPAEQELRAEVRSFV